jgi:hypothetical protein
MLIKEEVSHTPNVNFFTTSLSGSKYFLAKHLFNGNSDGNVKIFKDNQLEQIHDKFIKLSSPNVHNLISMFQHHLGRGSLLGDVVLATTQSTHFLMD